MSWDVLDVERASLSQLLEVIGQRAGGEGPTEIDPRAYRQLATFPTLISNQAIQDLLMGLLELENERSALLVLRQDESRDVRQFTDRIKELEIQLFEVGTNYLESLDGHLASVDESLESVSRELEEFPEQEMEYLRLYRDRSVLGEALTLLEAQLRLAEVQDAIRDEGVRIIDTGVIAPEDEAAAVAQRAFADGHRRAARREQRGLHEQGRLPLGGRAVSYTHLTLPTILLV